MIEHVGKTKCPDCNGDGGIRCEAENSEFGPGTFGVMDCDTCGGTGIVQTSKPDELNRPRVMKRYSEDCKPESAGWYWVVYSIFGPEPMYYSGTDWYESESMDYAPRIIPKWWLEMETLPIIPESKA